MLELEFTWELATASGVYFLILIVLAILAYRPQANDKEYFLAQSKIPAFFSWVSIVATESSVATILIFPQIGYQGNLALIFLPLGYILGRFLVAHFYLPFLYKNQKLAIYELLSKEKSVQVLISCTYLLAKFISGGVRFFLGTLALTTLFGGEIWFWGALMAGLCGLYSLLGGLRAVVWTDQIQGAFIFLGGLALIFFIGNQFILSTGITSNEMFSSIFTTSTKFINLNWALENAYFSPLLFIAGVILSIGSHGTDQDLLQRILATANLKSAKRALILSGLGACTVITIYLFIGYFISLTGFQDINAGQTLISYIKNLSQPWLTSCFALLLFAAAMSTIDSALHANAAVFKSILQYKINLSSRSYSFLALIALCSFAIGAFYIHHYFRDFLALAMGSMNYVNGGLIAIFTLAIPMKHSINLKTVLVALVSGLATCLVADFLIDPKPAWPYITIASSFLAFFTSFCFSHKKPK